MSTLDADMVAAIDARINASLQKQLTAMGTVVAVTGLSDALVVFDGSTLGVPVKVGGDVSIGTGDRVGLVRFGLWWVAVMTMTRRWPASRSAFTVQTNGTTTSSSYGDMPTTTTLTFTKMWSTTNVWVELIGSCYTTVGSTAVQYGVNFSSNSQPPISTTDASFKYFNGDSFEHRSAPGSISVPNLAADTYTVTVQWKRTTGTGVLTVDGNDTEFLSVMEVQP